VPRTPPADATAPGSPPAADSASTPRATPTPGTAAAAGSPPAESTEPPAQRSGRKPLIRGSFARELPFLLLIAFLLALLIKAFVVQAFYIPSGSMERTLLIGDRVLVNKLVYRIRDVHRGEVVVFNGKGTGFQDLNESQISEPSNGFERLIRDIQRLLGLGAPNETDFIKRVIGVGGDTVACCDSQGRILVNGTPLDEPYIYDNSTFSPGPNGNKRDFAGTGNVRTVHVPKGQLFVMGDHRGNSSDSRVHGTIPENKVIGRAFIRVWPVSRIGLLHVPKTFSHVSSAAFAVVPTLPPVEAAAAVVPVALIGRRRRRRRRAQRRLPVS
jgi:signal peptidase I